MIEISSRQCGQARPLPPRGGGLGRGVRDDGLVEFGRTGKLPCPPHPGPPPQGGRGEARRRSSASPEHRGEAGQRHVTSRLEPARAGPEPRELGNWQRSRRAIVARSLLRRRERPCARPRVARRRGDRRPRAAAFLQRRRALGLIAQLPLRLLGGDLDAFNQSGVVRLAPMRLHVAVAIGVEDTELHRVEPREIGELIHLAFQREIHAVTPKPRIAVEGTRLVKTQKMSAWTFGIV